MFGKLKHQEKVKTPKKKIVDTKKVQRLRPSSIRLTGVDDLQPQNNITSNLFGLPVRSVGVESLLFAG